MSLAETVSDHDAACLWHRSFSRLSVPPAAQRTAGVPRLGTNLNTSPGQVTHQVAQAPCLSLLHQTLPQLPYLVHQGTVTRTWRNHPSLAEGRAGRHAGAGLKQTPCGQPELV